MQSKARTVPEYLKSLPEDRRRQIETVRKAIRKHLPRGFEEVMNWGMITYQVPLKDFPDTYNGQPLLYAALTSQKNHMAVYLSGVYAVEAERRRFESAYKASGKRMDMGKSCVRFKSIDDLPLELIGQSIAAFSMEKFVEVAGRPYARKKVRSRSKQRTAKQSAGKKAKKAASKKAPGKSAGKAKARAGKRAKQAAKRGKRVAKKKSAARR